MGDRQCASWFPYRIQSLEELAAWLFIWQDQVFQCHSNSDTLPGQLALQKHGLCPTPFPSAQDRGLSAPIGCEQPKGSTGGFRVLPMPFSNTRTLLSCAEVTTQLSMDPQRPLRSQFVSTSGKSSMVGNSSYPVF